MIAEAERYRYRIARERLERTGWIQRQLRNKDGYCLIGALCNIGQGSMWRIMLQLSNAVSDIPAWNDHPTRTKEDVILLLKYAEADDLTTWKELYG